VRTLSPNGRVVVGVLHKRITRDVCGTSLQGEVQRLRIGWCIQL